MYANTSTCTHTCTHTQTQTFKQQSLRTGTDLYAIGWAAWCTAEAGWAAGKGVLSPSGWVVAYASAPREGRTLASRLLLFCRVMFCVCSVLYYLLLELLHWYPIYVGYLKEFTHTTSPKVNAKASKCRRTRTTSMQTRNLTTGLRNVCVCGVPVCRTKVMPVLSVDEKGGRY